MLFKKVKTWLIALMAGVSAMLFFMFKRSKKHNEELEEKVEHLERESKITAKLDGIESVNYSSTTDVEKAIAVSNANANENNSSETNSKPHTEDNFVEVTK